MNYLTLQCTVGPVMLINPNPKPAIQLPHNPADFRCSITFGVNAFDLQTGTTLLLLRVWSYIILYFNHREVGLNK